MNLLFVIVDDEETDRYLMRRSLKKTGVDAELLEFSTGDDFIAAIYDDQSPLVIKSTACTVLVVLDINMPGLNGFEVVDKIAQGIEQERLPKELYVILMCSSSEHPDDKLDALNRSIVREYMAKPVTAEKLRDIIDQYCKIDQ